MEKTICPYNCKCTRKIKNVCCAPKGFECTAKRKEREVTTMTEREMFIKAVERTGRPYFWYDDNTMVLEGDGGIEIDFNEQGQIIAIL